jgi:hypothetical protein|eukprot:scaffold21424_cov143-Isochrysis_galbana.AAC.5
MPSPSLYLLPICYQLLQGTLHPAVRARVRAVHAHAHVPLLAADIRYPVPLLRYAHYRAIRLLIGYQSYKALAE